MLYILGGAPRGGKTIISQRLVEEAKIPYFCTDFLISVLQNGIPDLDIHHGHPFIIKAEKLWPMIKPLLSHIVQEDPKYLVEGDGLLPKYLAELRDQFPNEIRVCFTGYTDLTPEEKLKQVRSFGGQKDDWTKKRSDEELLGSLVRMIEFSKYLKEECPKYGIPYFDSSTDFKTNVDAVAKYFLN